MTSILRRARARAAHAPGDQRGFTITEVVVVVVVMGLVIAPIALGVTQALQLTPDAGARTKVAADTSLLADRFNTDIANSSVGGGVLSGQVPNPHQFATLDVSCGSTSAATLFWPANSWIVLATDTTLKSSARWFVSYSAEWTAVSGGYKLTLRRNTTGAGSLAYDANSAMLTGYCVTGEKVATITNVAKGGGSGSANRRVSMSIWVRRTISSPPTVVTLNAAVRDTDV